MLNLSAGWPIDYDFHCLTCGYNLRTRLPSDICPECATPIAASAARRDEFRRVLFSPRRAIVACCVLLTATALAVLLNILYFTSYPSRYFFLYSTSLVLFFVYHAIYAVGVYYFLTGIRPTFFSPPGAWWRILIVLLKAVGLCAYFVNDSLMILMNWNLYAYHTFPPTAYFPLTQSIFIFEELIQLTLTFICIGYVVRLCRALGGGAFTGAVIVQFCLSILAGLFYLAIRSLTFLNYAFSGSILGASVLTDLRAYNLWIGTALGIAESVLLLILIRKLRPYRDPMQQRVVVTKE